MNYREEVNRRLDSIVAGDSLHYNAEHLREIFTKVMNELAKSEEKCKHFQKKVIDVNQDLRDVIAQKNDELERYEKENTWLRKSLNKSEEIRGKLADGNMRLSEQIDGLTKGESLSLDEFREIRTTLRTHPHFINNNLYYKIVKIIKEMEPVVVKEMTVEEIERALGHTIKVVK